MMKKYKNNEKQIHPEVLKLKKEIARRRVIKAMLTKGVIDPIRLN